MPNQFLSPEGDLEEHFITEYWLIDQYVGDELWTWGANATGQLGINNTINRSTPVTTFAGGTNWGLVASGGGITAAVKTDGTLWTWGANESGQLGNNQSNALLGRTIPVTTFSGGTNWRQVDCGDDHMAAIKTDGTLWVWGDGTSDNGELGVNRYNVTNVDTPVTTFAGGTNWKQVSCASAQTAAIKTDGTLWMWGSGLQTGTNSTADKSTPVTTFAGGNNWKQVSISGNNSGAIKTDGTLWVWGSNGNGSAGINFAVGVPGQSYKSTPVTTFAGGTNWKQVAAGVFFMAAIKTDGTLWTWGDNANGQLGTNNTIDRSTPVTTFAGGNNWKQVSCGNDHMAAIKTDGTLWTWGLNSSGQLGTNNTTTRSIPVTTFAGGNNWKRVFCKINNTAAVSAGTTPDLPLS